MAEYEWHGWGASDITMNVEGIGSLLRDAAKTGVDAKDLSKFTYQLARPIANLARSLAPKGKTGKLRRSIRPVRSKNAVRVRAGGPRVPYVARRHWGDDGESGGKWLSVAEERLRAQTIAGIAGGVEELLKKNGLK